MKAKDMLTLCQYLMTFEDHKYGSPTITMCYNDIVIYDYHNQLDFRTMDELGCEWEPSEGGYKVRDVL